MAEVLPRSRLDSCVFKMAVGENCELAKCQLQCLVVRHFKLCFCPSEFLVLNVKYSTVPLVSKHQTNYVSFSPKIKSSKILKGLIFLIAAGSYVALTLLGRTPGKVTPGDSISPPINERVSAPRSVNVSKLSVENLMVMLMKIFL